MLLQFNDDNFSDNLQYYRKAKRLTRAELARQADIDIKLIRGIERGRFYAQRTGDQYRRLCSILNAPLNLPRHDTV